MTMHWMGAVVGDMQHLLVSGVLAGLLAFAVLLLAAKRPFFGGRLAAIQPKWVSRTLLWGLACSGILSIMFLFLPSEVDVTRFGIFAASPAMFLTSWILTLILLIHLLFYVSDLYEDDKRALFKLFICLLYIILAAVVYFVFDLGILLDPYDLPNLIKVLLAILSIPALFFCYMFFYVFLMLFGGIIFFFISIALVVVHWVLAWTVGMFQSGPRWRTCWRFAEDSCSLDQGVVSLVYVLFPGGYQAWIIVWLVLVMLFASGWYRGKKVLMLPLPLAFGASLLYHFTGSWVVYAQAVAEASR